MKAIKKPEVAEEGGQQFVGNPFKRPLPYETFHQLVRVKQNPCFNPPLAEN